MALSQSDPIELTCEILVAGGGPAGVPCALAAARSGARVILVQDRPVLGGNASSEVRMHIVGANGTGRFDRGEALITEAREGGIIEEIRLENCVRNPQRSASMFDLILYDLCRREPNLTLMLNTSVVGAERESNANDAPILAVLADRPSTEERFRISAQTFIDCTGDGRLGFEAGASFMEGRESREQFGESLAQPVADSHRLGSTILLTARKHTHPMPFQAPDWARRFSREDLKLRLYATPGEEEPSHEYGYWWAEWGGTLDTIRDNEVIRDELVAVALGIWDHVKNGPPEERSLEESRKDPLEASHWALDWIGFLPGKRESRRFVGQHVLTEQDLMTSRSFPDAIAYGGWSIDLHPPQGVDAPDTEPCEQHPVPWLFDIPLSCCVSREVPNLMFAGRNLSATHVAFASTRVMATCAVVGQAVGTVAALGVRDRILPSAMASTQSFVEKAQRQLLADDSFLIGCDEKGRCPVVSGAQITSSGSQSDAPAIAVNSGQTRSVHGERGAPRGRELPGLHRWMSEGLAAWIRFDWERPQSFVGIQLIFDTGLHRHLTLSHHDGYTAAKMQWGRPQPETVRAYRVEGLSAENQMGEEAWQCLVEVDDNYQRLRRHFFTVPVSYRAIRIVVTGTNGLDHARICGVRFLAESVMEC
ncbi:MAG: FAD-dependent oxidoreductase [Verrucomicrobiae bacterium]|nr:FAD-dependent oxidoreductase [Verrucomicrobiae bacterium]